jgi:hypothetical protein
VLVEEAGGVFLTRGGVPLGMEFHEATLSSNAALADSIREALDFERGWG